MKGCILGVLLAAEAVACVLLSFVRASLAGLFPAAVAFPFEQIGMGLRAPLLSGRGGNAAAMVLYLLISRPLGALLMTRFFMEIKQLKDENERFIYDFVT